MNKNKNYECEKCGYVEEIESEEDLKFHKEKHSKTCSGVLEESKGDCIQKAMEASDMKGLLFCYARIKGKIEGQTYIHCWNEDDEMCYDFSRGRNISMNKEDYYMEKGIEKDSIKKLTFKEVKIKSLRCIRKGKNEADWIK